MLTILKLQKLRWLLQEFQASVTVTKACRETEGGLLGDALTERSMLQWAASEVHDDAEEAEVEEEGEGEGVVEDEEGEMWEEGSSSDSSEEDEAAAGPSILFVTEKASARVILIGLC